MTALVIFILGPMDSLCTGSTLDSVISVCNLHFNLDRRTVPNFLCYMYIIEKLKTLNILILKSSNNIKSLTASQ